MTGSVRETFDRLRVLRAPIVVSLLSFFLFAYPPQSVEVYRSVAQVVALQTTELGARSTEVGAGVGALLALGLVIGVVAYLLERALLHRSSGLAPEVLGALPALGAAIGCLRGATGTPSAEVAAAARLALADVLETGPDPPPVIKEIFETTLTAVLNSDFYLYAMAGGLALLSGAIFVLVWIAAGPIARALGSVWSHLPEQRTWVVLAALPVLALLVLMICPGGWLIPAGPVALLAVFAAITLVGLAALTYLASTQGIPLVGATVAYVAVISMLGLNDSNRIYSEVARAPSRPAAVSEPKLEDAFASWYKSRADRAQFAGKRYPIYVVAAQGGGIYAAYHTGMVLGGLQDICPWFGAHTFAISAVSGGSVGAATHIALAHGGGMATSPPTGAGCVAHDQRPKWIERQYSNVRLADRVLSADMLSPLVYGMLYRDFVQMFVPFRTGLNDRARQLEMRLESKISEDLEREVGYQRVKSRPANLVAQPVGDYWSPDGALPALLLNTTEIASGRRRVIAPFVFRGDDVRFLPVWQVPLNGVPLSTAAVLSARFPWITPPGWYDEIRKGLGIGGERSERNRLVDGGYFENSGVATALDLIRSMKAVAVKEGFDGEIDLRLIVLTKGEDAAETFLGLDRVLAPLHALLSTRSARGFTMIRQAQRELADPSASGGRNPVVIVELRDLGYPPPLGWRLSPVSGFLIEAQNGRSEECVPGPAFEQTKKGRFDADCLVAQIARDLEPLK